MNGTALYRALVEAGASGERAKEAAESVVHAPQGATKADIADVRTEVADVKTEVADVRSEVADVRTEVAGVRVELARVKTELSDRIAALETTMERSFRAMTFRLIGVFFALQALMLAALRFTGPA